MPTKTIKKYHFIPIKLTKIRKLVNVTCWQGCGNKLLGVAGVPITFMWPFWIVIWHS